MPSEAGRYGAPRAGLIHGSSGASSPAYFGFIRELEKLFLALAPREVHWVRIFVGSYEGKRSGADALLDNEPWPEALALLHRWEWDFPQEYRTLRHFFIALPGPTATQPT